jgi:hypothetical protein
MTVLNGDYYVLICECWFWLTWELLLKIVSLIYMILLINWSDFGWSEKLLNDIVFLPNDPIFYYYNNVLFFDLGLLQVKLVNSCLALAYSILRTTPSLIMLNFGFSFGVAYVCTNSFALIKVFWLLASLESMSY